MRITVDCIHPLFVVYALGGYRERGKDSSQPRHRCGSLLRPLDPNCLDPSKLILHKFAENDFSAPFMLTRGPDDALGGYGRTVTEF